MRAVFANYHGMSLSDEDWDNIIEDFLHDPEPYLEFGDYFHQSQTFRNLLPVKGMPELVLTAVSTWPSSVPAIRILLHNGAKTLKSIMPTVLKKSFVSA